MSGYAVYRCNENCTNCATCRYWNGEKSFNPEYIELEVYDNKTVCLKTGAEITPRGCCHDWTSMTDEDWKKISEKRQKEQIVINFDIFD